MKKTLILLLCLMLCVFVFGGCEESSDDAATADEAIAATADEATVAPEDFRPEEDFTGNYGNSEYTAKLKKNKSGEMEITVRSGGSDGTAYEWKMSGYLSDINYKIICDNVEKTVVTTNQDGKEKSRETAYKNGSSKIVFSDSDHFTWENGMEGIEQNEFSRTDK